MAEWTDEATEYLEGYLKQVSALTKHQGEDVDDIVNGLRDHVANEIAVATNGVVDIDVLFAVLANIGTPEDVVNLDKEIGASLRPAPVEIQNKHLTLMGWLVRVFLVLWGVPAVIMSLYFLSKYIRVYF